MSLMTQLEFLLYLNFSEIFKYTFVCVAPLKPGPWTLYISKIATDNGDDDDVDDEDLWYVHEYVCVLWFEQFLCIYFCSS